MENLKLAEMKKATLGEKPRVAFCVWMKIWDYLRFLKYQRIATPRGEFHRLASITVKLW